MIIDFTEPKKVKDILEQIDGSLSEEGQAMLFAKLRFFSETFLLIKFNL